ncbi:MAG: HEPN domain-containing protein [Promethearchaeota archaeon]
MLLLESSYLNSRYIYNIYTREDAFNAIKIMEKIMEAVNRARNDEK